jgi:uncharacterized protein YidB (DUF937 family)
MFKEAAMGLFDDLTNVVEKAVQNNPGGLSGVMNDALASAGGLDGVVSKLNDAGLGAKVNSWLGNGANTPLTADEVRTALTPDHLQQIASKLGISPDAVAGAIAQHLPNAVDQASPNGKLNM